MKLKEKFQRFWTLSKSHEGFTLVELIVVIAILAILAGVAIPVYNGYIKKANTAADQTLLDSINTAFVAACVDNGINQYDVADGGAVISVGADGTLGNLTKVILVDGTNYTNEVKASFDLFFAGNVGAKFNTFRSLPYANGMFSGSEAQFGGVYASFIDGIKAAYGAQIGAINDSTYATMGVEGLMGQLNDVTDIAADLSDGGAMQGIIGSAGFLESALVSMGKNPADYNGDTSAMLSDLASQQSVLAQQMVDASGGTMSLEDARNKVQANAVVLYTAQVTQNKDSAGVQTLINTANKETILNNLRSGNADGLAQAALMCGLYTSYVNSGECKAENKQEVNVNNVLGAMESDADFQKYISDTRPSGTQGYKDLQGYLGALSVINSTTGNADVTENLMVNGFADQDLINALNGLIG